MAQTRQNFVLDTSPGKHQVVWRVSGFSQDEAESLLHNLANQFGGDLAATDSTRVLRLPEFANRKLPEEFIVQARQETDAVYILRDFTIDEGSPETPWHFGDYRKRERTVPGDHKSQSEHDWAYAKRALARGDDPEVVIQCIADYRVEDKDDRTTTHGARSRRLRLICSGLAPAESPRKGKKLSRANHRRIFDLQSEKEWRIGRIGSANEPDSTTGRRGL
jgi:hypothetical protein